MGGRVQPIPARRDVGPRGYGLGVPDQSREGPGVALSQLQPEEKAKRATAFGAVAEHYQRYRPGPPETAVDWLVPDRVRRVVDLGAGTGLLTRLLLGRADEVVAVEPDGRMRAVLREEVPGAAAVEGRGEAIPLADATVDAVVASSSWHWMDPVPTLLEVGRVLVPGGVLGAMWSGPDPEGSLLAQARTLLGAGDTAGTEQGGGGAESGRDPGLGELAALMADARRAPSTLEVPPGVPFDQPEHAVFTWSAPLDAEQLVGLLGTLSWIINLDEDARQRLLVETRRLLREWLGLDGELTVDVEFRADVWRARRRR